MNLWAVWLDVIRGLLDALTYDVGLGLGLAVIVATVLLRTAVLPISWSTAYRNTVRQRKMKRLQPLLQDAKERSAGKPDEYLRRLTALYEQHGLQMVDAKSALGAFAQIPVLTGMLQVLRGVGDGVRFLWVPNLLKADTLLAIVAGATTALMIMANPDLPEQARVLLILLPSIIAVFTALHFGSALALYWTTSNLFSMSQTFALRMVIERRIRRGTLQV